LVKTILDEIFGVENFRGWLVWLIGTGAKGRQNWSNQHNDILCYSKGEKFTFNHDDPDLREPFAELSSQMHFNKTDKEGRKYRERIVNGKSYIYYADDGKLVGSVWTDISSMAANSPILNESVGYPTQKPEKLLTGQKES
jgi:adenine specific DNA methylase Mod